MKLAASVVRRAAVSLADVWAMDVVDFFHLWESLDEEAKKEKAAIR